MEEHADLFNHVGIELFAQMSVEFPNDDFNRIGIDGSDLGKNDADGSVGGVPPANVDLSESG